MITENVSTLKINKLTQAQYDREYEAGNIEENVLYLTPEVEKADKVHEHSGADITFGTINSDRLPITPISKGGTNATNAVTARSNLDVYSKEETNLAINTAIAAAIEKAIAGSY